MALYTLLSLEDRPDLSVVAPISLPTLWQREPGEEIVDRIHSRPATPGAQADEGTLGAMGNSRKRKLSPSLANEVGLFVGGVHYRRHDDELHMRVTDCDKPGRFPERRSCCCLYGEGTAF